MFVFDRKKFFDGYRKTFGPLTQDLVNALEFLLGQLEKDARFPSTETGRRQVSYCLATFKWETAHTLQPIDEIGTDAYFNKRYGPQTKTGKALGNLQIGDGARFHGRGYVQLTGRANYNKAKRLTGIDLLIAPHRAKEPALAYEIAMQGMKDGWFTGRKLSQFIKDGAPPDYESARTIINGHDQAGRIADLARRFDEILSAAQKKV